MDKLYSIVEVATKLNLSDKTLRRWEQAGRFTPSRTLGNQRRYSLEDLQILDAIKHGTITSQKELLTLDQAALLAGVSVSSILRWENEGKIHPLITAGNTYYPRERLLGKMEELKRSVVEPRLPPSSPMASDPTPLTLHQPKPKPSISPFLINACITLVLLITYHLLFATAKEPVSPIANQQPDTGDVQGATTSLDPRLDLLEQKLADLLHKDSSKPVTALSSFTLDNATLITGNAILLKGSNQTSVINDQITQGSIITISFQSDYAPAKKYWLTHKQGSFTLHTDFPVSSDSSFNYLVLQ